MTPEELADLAAKIESIGADRSEYVGSTAEEDENGVVVIKSAKGKTLMWMDRETYDEIKALVDK